MRGQQACLIVLLSAIAATASLSVRAQDAEQGRLLAERWCSSCHLVEPGHAASDVAPPFGIIARDPAITPERLHAWLVSPHPPMINPGLSRQEEDDVVAYLLSLR